jgi:Zn-dependent protease with chaperone function
MASDSAPVSNISFFDGLSSRKRRVTLRLADGLDILENEVVVATWPYADVRRADGPASKFRLSCVSAAPLARLDIDDAATAEAVAARCASLDVGSPHARHTWRIVGWSLAAICSILAVTFFGIPYAADRLAPLIPFRVEQWIGKSVDTQVRAIFGGKECNAAAGRDAFVSLVSKLKTAGNIETPLEAQVISIALPNAFALPGGKVYVTDGLLQKARNADEVAGVIAHELGHVYHRDTMRKIIQTGGSSFLIGLLFGDLTGASAVIFATRSLVDSSYSRDAERDADAFAAETMHKLGRSPKPMGEFLLRITGAQANKSITILSSHPLSEDRLTVLSKLDRANTGDELLTATEWQALKAICK